MTATVGRDPNEIVVGGDRAPYVDPAIVGSIQNVFARSRLSYVGWQSRLSEGRVDGRNVWRNDAHGSVDIFRDRHAPSTTKVNVFILVDSSGSMSGSNACRAQDVAGTLAAAFGHIPSVRLQVWQHNALQECNLYRVYAPGSNKIVNMLRNIGGGNADGFALEAVGQMALKAARPDERTLVIMISDGRPSVQGMGATNHDIEGHSRLVSQRLRAKGAIVLAVAIAGTNEAHKRMYGEDSILSFDQQSPTKWLDLAQQFATIFGRILRPA